MSKKFKYLKMAPEIGQLYFFLNVSPFHLYSWKGTTTELYWLKTQRIYATDKDFKLAIEFVNNFYISNPEKLNYIISIPESHCEVWYGLYMDGQDIDCHSIKFDFDNEMHRDLYNKRRLYRTCEDLKNATNLITQALA